MQVASLELCKTLHELSGWDDLPNDNDWYTERGVIGYRRSGVAPAYDLGYLLRKLPSHDKDGIHANFGVSLLLGGAANLWGAGWESDSGEYELQQANTPEDAAAKLAIELFKQGVLTRAGDAR